MDKDAEIGLDFVIDKLTNSIENVITGDRFQTEISILQNSDLKSLTKKNGWLFYWSEEFKNPVRDIYKLTMTEVGDSTEEYYYSSKGEDVQGIETELDLIKLISKSLFSFINFS